MKQNYTKQEFMWKLERAINKMPLEDRLKALRYYNEYFDEAGPEREAELLNQLENPDVIAKRIMAEYAVSQTEKREPIPQSGRKQLRYIWMILLGICAAPIAIPMVIAIVAVAFSLLVTLFAVAFAFILTAAVLILVGIVVLGVGIVTLFTEPISGVMGIGAALGIAGIGMLLLVLFYLIIVCAIPAMTRGIGKLFTRVSKKNK